MAVEYSGGVAGAATTRRTVISPPAYRQPSGPSYADLEAQRLAAEEARRRQEQAEAQARAYAEAQARRAALAAQQEAQREANRLRTEQYNIMQNTLRMAEQQRQAALQARHQAALNARNEVWNIQPGSLAASAGYVPAGYTGRQAALAPAGYLAEQQREQQRLQNAQRPPYAIAERTQPAHELRMAAEYTDRYNTWRGRDAWAQRLTEHADWYLRTHKQTPVKPKAKPTGAGAAFDDWGSGWDFGGDGGGYGGYEYTPPPPEWWLNMVMWSI